MYHYVKFAGVLEPLPEVQGGDAALADDHEAFAVVAARDAVIHVLALKSVKLTIYRHGEGGRERERDSIVRLYRRRLKTAGSWISISRSSKRWRID